MPLMAGMEQFHRPDLADIGLGAEGDGPLIGIFRIPDPEGHGAGAGAVLGGEGGREGIGLGVDDVVHVALAIERDVLRTVTRDRRVKPMSSSTVLSAAGSGWANSTNSKPSVPIGLWALISAGGASWGKGPMASSSGDRNDGDSVVRIVCKERAKGRVLCALTA